MSKSFDSVKPLAAMAADGFDGSVERFRRAVPYLIAMVAAVWIVGRYRLHPDPCC